MTNPKDSEDNEVKQFVIDKRRMQALEAKVKELEAEKFALTGIADDLCLRTRSLKRSLPPKPPC